MATRPKKGGASAPSNVVRLPTAAPRQVQQRHNKHTRAAKAELPQFPDRHIFPCIRRQAEAAKLVSHAKRTPELALALAIFEALDDSAKLRVQQRLAHASLSVTAGHPALVALELTQPRTNGEMCNLFRAVELVEEGRL